MSVHFLLSNDHMALYPTAVLNLISYTTSGMLGIWKNETGLTFVIIIELLREFYTIHILYIQENWLLALLDYIQ
jgi:hypothetical protein